MLYFTLGRAGSGKTSWIRRLVADFVKSGHYDVSLIIPEQFSFESERAMLSLLGEQDFDKVNILSFTRLAENLFDEYQVEQAPYISEGARAALMILAVDSLQDKLGLYKPGKKTNALIRDLLFMDEELKLCALNADDLHKTEKLMTEGSLKTKISDFSKILSLYQGLVSEKYSDERDILNRLCDFLKERSVFKDKIIAFDAFRGFTKSEYSLIEQIMIQARAVYFTFSANSLEDSSSDFGVFSHTARAVKKLTALARKNNIPIARPQLLSGHASYRNFPLKINHYQAKELHALEHMLWDSRPRTYFPAAENICVYTAENRYDECDAVALLAKKLVREEGYRCREIAVIERNSGTYRPSLVAAFRKYGLPVFEDNRHSIASEPLIAASLSALEVAIKGFSSEAIMRYLKSGLVGLSTEQIADIENYVFVWQIEGRAWRQEWTSHPEGYGNEFKEKDRQKLAELNTIRDKIISPLMELREALKAKSVKENCTAIYNFLIKEAAPSRLKEMAGRLTSLGEERAAENSVQVWDSLMGILDTLVNTLDGQDISPSRFFDILQLCISLTDIGSIPHGLDEITIGTADRIRIQAPRAVFLVGTNADSFPLSHENSMVFSSRERSRLKEYGLELSDSNEQKTVEERHITYNALSLAKEKLFVSYSLNSMGGDSLLPSEIPKFLTSRFPNCRQLSSEDLDDLYRIESPDTGFEIAAKLFSENSPLSSALNEYFSQRPSYRDRLATVKRLALEEDFKIKDENISKELFGRDMKLSPSRVENFYNCPFAYFCHYGISAKPKKIARIDSLQQGLILHYIFEQLFSNHTVEQISDMNEKEQRGLISAALDTYVNEKLGGKDALPNRLLFQLKSFAATAFVVLERILYEFGSSKFKIKDIELGIGGKGKIPEYTLTLDDGSTLSISGTIDRLDLLKEDNHSYFRIIDYKSGGKEFKLSEVLEGINMQMLIYLMSVWQNGEDLYGKISPAGVLYLPARLGDYKLHRRGNESEIQNHKITNGKMDGILLRDEKVVRSMEPELKAKVIPVKQKSSGELDGNCASMELFKLLHHVVDDKLIEMAERLHKGDIAALPTSISKRTACDYCEYRIACTHEDTDEYREINSLETKKTIIELEKEAGTDV